MRINPTAIKWGERGIGAFKYLVAGYMMLAGLLTPFMGIDGTSLGILYENLISLTIIGLIIFASGAMLMWGKVRKSKVWTGRGLMWVYMCFLFAAAINYVAFSGAPETWVSNLVMGIIMGALWLRWKFKTQYINPNHFKRDIEELK